MKLLTLESKEAALERSRAEWEKVLGRPKNPEDVTEFLWELDTDEKTLKVPEADTEKLTIEEITAIEEKVAVAEGKG